MRVDLEGSQNLCDLKLLFVSLQVILGCKPHGFRADVTGPLSVYTKALS